MTMNPPPPILPATGCVTASAKAVATAASTALPPCFRTARPTSEAGSETVTTTPLRNSGDFSPPWIPVNAPRLARAITPIIWRYVMLNLHRFQEILPILTPDRAADTDKRREKKRFPVRTVSMSISKNTEVAARRAVHSSPLTEDGRSATGQYRSPTFHQQAVRHG